MESFGKNHLDTNANELKSLQFYYQDKLLQKSANQLLGIFPEEVWLIILNKIQDISDLENVSNASLYFRHLLTSRASLFLFPGVFKIMASQWISSFDDLFTLTRNCRLTCGSWNRSIEEFYESQNAPINGKNDRKTIHEKRKVGNVTFPMWNTSGISEFIQHFDKTHYFANPPWRNPFFGRMVTFNDTKFQPGRNTNGQDYLVRFWNDISNILMKYGSHIWYCTIHLEDKFPSREEYYFKISEWLDLMPNLRSLKLSYYCNSKNKSYSKSRLEAEIQDHRLPRLKLLESLETSNLPIPILKELIHRNGQVSRLVINEKICDDKL